MPAVAWAPPSIENRAEFRENGGRSSDQQVDGKAP